MSDKDIPSMEVFKRLAAENEELRSAWSHTSRTQAEAISDKTDGQVSDAAVNLRKAFAEGFLKAGWLTPQQAGQLRELRHYADHTQFCARKTDLSECDCGYEMALSVATATDFAAMRAEGEALRKEIERRVAPMKRGPFVPPETP